MIKLFHNRDILMLSSDFQSEDSISILKVILLTSENISSIMTFLGGLSVFLMTLKWGAKILRYTTTNIYKKNIKIFFLVNRCQHLMNCLTVLYVQMMLGGIFYYSYIAYLLHTNGNHRCLHKILRSEIHTHKFLHIIYYAFLKITNVFSSTNKLSVCLWKIIIKKWVTSLIMPDVQLCFGP
jgi:hypothetical protein